MHAFPAVDRRFVPTSAQDYSRRAKHLAWITQRPLQECQEILAQAYGYGDAHELRAVITAAHPNESQPTGFEAIGRRMQIEAAFGTRLLHVMAGGDKPADMARLTRREWLARDIGLTEPWDIHKSQYARAKNQILLASLDEPAALRGVTPLDYGRAYCTGLGEYTIALTAAGQAVRDVLGWWLEDEEGPDPIPPHEQHRRIAVLRARHPSNPWLIADAVLSAGHELARRDNNSSDAWEGVLSDARIAIALFERILSSEQCAKYAGAKLISSGFGFGNEAYSYPSTLYYAGVAALNTDRISEAIGFLERAYLMDPRDGAGARFALSYAYALRAGYAQAPESWDELTFAHVLRAVTLIETGDLGAGIAALAYALSERLWGEFNNGYAGSPRSLAALLKAAAPVATSHGDAWGTLTAIARNSAVQRSVRTFVSMARRSEYLDLSEDPASVAEQIKRALDGQDEHSG